MSDSPRVIRVDILGKEYSIGCPPDEEEALHRAAEMLDKRMREIRDGGRVVGLERIAIMAALNIANDLQQCEKVKDGYQQSVGSRIRQIQDKIETALNRGHQIEF